MKIGINATIFENKNYTGIARSVHEILRIWAKEYTNNEYYLLSNKAVYLMFDLPSNWHIIDEHWKINKGWRAIQQPLLIKKLKLDAYWGTDYTLPLKIKNVKYFLTIYDMALFKFKNIGDPKAENVMRKSIKTAYKRADKVIAISYATSNDIAIIFDSPKEKIAVSYCGGLATYYHTENEIIDAEKISSILNFEEKFFLFISTIEPRKNIETIIKAYEIYVKKFSSDMKLVIAGGKGWRCENVYELVTNSIYKDRIIMPGFITDYEKSYLLSRATVFVYPSLYEGFGIPILEAFSYHLPVITTRVSSMPEVGGTASFYIDNPLDYNALVDQMHTIVCLSDREKKKIDAKMQEQLNFFSWEKNASEMINLLEQEIIDG